MNLVFDIFPADDVRGTRLVRLTSDDYLQGTMFRTELVGVGKGRLVLQADQAVVTAANLARDNYVEVFDLTLSGAYALGAFFLEEGDFDALSDREQAGRILTFGGRGELSYLSRGILGTQALSGAAGPFDQHYIDTTGQWDWGSDPATETFGAILRRIIYESALMTPDPLPEVQLVDITWDDNDDSDGNPWPPFLGRYQIPVGTNLLEAAADLLKHGIELVANSDFEYGAYNAGTYGTDRTSATFAAGKVRFEAGVNIAADLSRAIHGATDASHAIVTDSGGLSFDVVTSPEYTSGDVVRYVGITATQDTGPDDLESLGENVLTNRRTFVDQFAFPHPTGYAPLSGLYTPGPPASAAHYWKGDYVTIHTGSSPYDADEQTIRVAAIEWNVDDAGNWLPTVELGAQYLSVGQANISGELTRLATAGHTHPPNPELCRIGAASAYSTRLYFSNTAAGFSVAEDAAWADAGTLAVNQLKTTPDASIVGGSGFTWNAVNAAAGNYRGNILPYGVQITDPDLLDVIQAGGFALTMQARSRSRYGIGVSEAAQNNFAQMVVRVYRASTTTFIGTALAAHAAGSGTIFPAQATHTNRLFSGTLSAVAGAALNDWLIFEPGTRHIAPTTGATGSAVLLENGAASDLPSDESSTSLLNAWINLATAGEVLSPDNPEDTVHQGAEDVGTSIRAARCDHQHAHGLLSADGLNYHDIAQVDRYVVHGAGAPTTGDDEADGYTPGTIWIDNATGDVYILTDATTGAAVWEQINGGGGGLPDTRWEAVTNGTDIFVWEGADLVHEWKEY